ncbi:MAG: hypothetical protein U9P10_16005 [Thermodesulfobacteriota bacterium]|nr:hypothetical protein [Thermodesulfobacteriota bacterium]
MFSNLKMSGCKQLSIQFFFTAFILSILLCNHAFCCDRTDTLKVISFGKRSVINDDLPEARNQAVSDSLDFSVERAVVEILKPSDLSAALGLIFDKVMDDAQDYITTYRVLAEHTEKDRYMVAVEADVNMLALHRFFVDNGILNTEKENPSILLLISEQFPKEILPRYWWGNNPVPYHSFSCTAVQNYLKNQNFILISNYEKQDDVHFDFIHDSQAAVNLGRLLKADIVVMGKAVADRASNVMGDEKTYSASFSAEVINVESSEIISSVEEKGVAKSRLSEKGIENALKDAGEIAAERIARIIKQEWLKHSSKARLVEVTIAGSDYLSNFIMLRRVLNQMKGIEDVKTMEIGSEKALVNIMFRGSAKKLADFLMLKTFDDFGLEIFNVDDDSLSIRFVPEEDKEPVKPSDIENAYISE